MKTIETEIKRLKLIHGNRINAIANHKNERKVIEAKLDLLYNNPIRFESRIKVLEKIQHNHLKALGV